MRHFTRAAAVASAALLALSACAQDQPGDEGGDAFPTKAGLQLVAPAAPGGGWDGTARALQKAIEDEKVADDVQVVNVEGAGGTIGLSRFVSADDRKQLMVMGATLVGATLANDSDVTLDDAVPVARLTSEYHVLVVPKNSPYKTLDDFTAAFKADPGSQAIGGGSAGGTDQVTAGLYAEAVGVDPTKVNYIPFSGGGEALAAIVGGKVKAGISNVNEWAGQIESGDLRVLAVSAPEPLASLDAPTFTEQGVDVVLANWRGVLAPPSTTDAQVEQIQDFLAEVHESDAWKQTLETNGWEDSFMVGDDVEPFFDEQSEQIQSTLEQIGLV
ncbi:Bug family tripartite tricarboxylate transporter substrate binding protein [Aeromicrobium massiliense]|uniref:Bug family tripartite tricarboxylate transporter substrate binding protein n=1 Tax=Aeromicrobium massiliense TaxID=1464554 RepID=UPI0002E4F062|nr:tripartite tricarboxylate transporter substrate-binding protein [Aeromicrobium massiliense]